MDVYLRMVSRFWAGRAVKGVIWLLVCGVLSLPPWAFAQGLPHEDNPAPASAEASLSHSAAKAITLKAGTFTLGTVIYALGTGSLLAGSALSAINAAGSFVLLTANDYGWDYFWPNTNVKANNGAFQTFTSVSRNTAKYLTFKPMVTVLNLGTLYWWTGSTATTAVTGAAAVLMLPGMFYLNNTLWDWYDWQHTGGPAVSPKMSAAGAVQSLAQQTP